MKYLLTFILGAVLMTSGTAFARTVLSGFVQITSFTNVPDIARYRDYDNDTLCYVVLTGARSISCVKK